MTSATSEDYRGRGAISRRAALERNESDLAPRADPGRGDRRRQARKDTERSARVRALRPLRPVRPEFVHGGRPGILALDCGRGAKNALALRRELRLVADHAGGDAIDVWDFRSTKTKRIAGTIPLLFCRVG